VSHACTVSRLPSIPANALHGTPNYIEFLLITTTTIVTGCLKESTQYSQHPMYCGMQQPPTIVEIIVYRHWKTGRYSCTIC